LASVTLSNLRMPASEHLKSNAVRRRNRSNAEVIVKLQNAPTKRKSNRGILIGLIILVLIVAVHTGITNPLHTRKLRLRP
jgi:hypothetical protein